MNDDIELSLRQFVGAWETLGRTGPRYTRASHPGVELVFSGIPVSFFNAAFLKWRRGTPDMLRDQARRTCRFAAEQNVPWLLIATHECFAPGVDATAILDECGLAPIMNFTGMRAEHVSRLETIPPGLDLAEAADDAACASILDVNGVAYAVDLSPSNAALGRRSFWKSHCAILGRTDGKPSCSTVVFLIDGIRYVAFVATDPAHQRKGYAAAAMRYALDLAAARHGESPSVLHATDAGRPIYERMGYRVISTHTAFMEKRFLDAH
jgi:GNAT superfamily N-acetyltransferase